MDFDKVVGKTIAGLGATLGIMVLIFAIIGMGKILYNLIIIQILYIGFEPEVSV